MPFFQFPPNFPPNIFKKTIFNYYPEEENLDLSSLLRSEDDTLENFVLKDNPSSIIYSPKFLTDKAPEAPTTRILTSLFSRECLVML